MRMEVERESLREGAAPVVLETLSKELERNFAKLRDEAPDRPAYFLAYDLVEREQLWLEAQAGALLHDHIDKERVLDVDLRVGDRQLDNSHGQGGDYAGNGLGAGVTVSLEDEELSLAQALWLVTEAQYRLAMDAVEEAEAGEALRTRSDQPAHPDFSEEEAIEHYGERVGLDLSALSKNWGPLLAEASAHMSARPEVLESSAVMQVTLRNHSFVNSEGSRVFDGRARIRVMLSATGQAEDGMYLERFHSFDVFGPEDLPVREELLGTAKRLGDEVIALRAAPVAEPYTGPAVLEGPAAGVFFHEIFGHRLEGHRQKDDIEGQTFTQMVGKKILPNFLDVIDDPTISQAVAALDEKDPLSPVIEGADGLYLVKLLDRRDLRVREIGEVGENIRRILLSRKRRQVEAAWLASLAGEDVPVQIDDSNLASVPPPQGVAAGSRDVRPPAPPEA